MDFSGAWTWILIGIALFALIGFGVLGSRAMRSGKTPPGPPPDVDTGTHDEPTEDVAKVLDEGRHVHTSEDVSKSARDANRTLGH